MNHSQPLLEAFFELLVRESWALAAAQDPSDFLVWEEESVPQHQYRSLANPNDSGPIRL